MNRFKKHLLLVGLLFSTLLSVSNFAANTLSVRPNLVDSVRLSATRTTTTIPNAVDIDIMVAGFVDIKEFVFTVQWDATKLLFTSADNSTLSTLSTSPTFLSRTHHMSLSLPNSNRTKPAGMM